MNILTSFDPNQSWGLANVSLAGLDVSKVYDHLWAKYRIIVLDGNNDGNANDPVVVLDTKGLVVLTFGNHQAHKEIK